MEPTTPYKPKKVEPVIKTHTLVAKGCNLLEPFTLVWFKDNVPVEVNEINPWMQMQIKAGLMRAV